MQYHIQTNYFFENSEFCAEVALLLPAKSEAPFDLQNCFIPDGSKIYLFDETITAQWGYSIMLDSNNDFNLKARRRTHILRGDSWRFLEDEVGGTQRLIHNTLKSILQANSARYVPDSKFESFDIDSLID